MGEVIATLLGEVIGQKSLRIKTISQFSEAVRLFNTREKLCQGETVILNTDLVGFFTCVPKDRITQSVDKLVLLYIRKKRGGYSTDAESKQEASET